MIYIYIYICIYNLFCNQAAIIRIIYKGQIQGAVLSGLRSRKKEIRPNKLRESKARGTNSEIKATKWIHLGNGIALLKITQQSYQVVLNER